MLSLQNFLNFNNLFGNSFKLVGHLKYKCSKIQWFGYFDMDPERSTPALNLGSVTASSEAELNFFHYISGHEVTNPDPTKIELTIFVNS